MNNINVGDLVYIIGPKNYERSFNKTRVWWPKDMDNYIGKVFKVKEVLHAHFTRAYSTNSILVLNCRGSYYFTYDWVLKINDK